MEKKTFFSLPRATCPEAQGISSQAVVDILKELKAIDYVCHSFMVVYKGVVAAECYYYPFNADTTHCMYSVSKHITATALGFALDEGKISLDTKLCELFPDRLPKKKDEFYKDITIRHLVSMTAGKAPSVTLNKTKGDWFEHFSESKRAYPPGKTFAYVNECAYVLSACLKKVLGIGINDYLEPRLWEPLGIKKPYWETDRNGIEAGGWGIQLKTEDLAKLALCYHNKGFLNGKQIVPSSWIAQAIQNQKPKDDLIDPDRNKGYGYSVWRYTDTLWHFEGMFGQEAQVFQDKDLILVITAADSLPPRKDVIFNAYAEKMIIEPTAEALPNEEYSAFIASRAVDVYDVGTLRSPLEKSLEGKIISLKPHRFLRAIGMPLGVLAPATVFMSKNRAGNITDVSFYFTEEGCRFRWRENTEINEVFCCMTGDYHADKITLGEIEFTTYSAAKWLNENTLEISIRPMQSIARRIFTFRFTGKKVVMESLLSPRLTVILKSVSEDFAASIKLSCLRKPVERLFERAERFIEPRTRGVIVADRSDE